ncbi:class I poly(R)-hydroxyalkanoic acid synthase [Rhizobium sp. KVB221]|uniref:Class I poly(R)-hydroxyalkanoic acid synthase n=1 Tax=Rhizobium setariae TaxID=2801340 RepID=A0A936YWU5_9HYPH|nr:class I poly(R)-hydroxyalkanoic acid synthase [Rhizobium setariae]MBL0375060.1 class I poly(R)-hydroxyalkanoic acid synthase [Rhizobium setariae]
MAENGTFKGQSGNKLPGFDPAALDPFIIKDPEALTVNIARTLENLGKAASEWLGPRETGAKADYASEPATDIVRTLSKVVEYWLADPTRTLEAQTLLFSTYFRIWMQSLQNVASGVESGEAIVRDDKRFSDPDWKANPFFNFLRQVYTVTADWADKLVTNAEGLDDHTRHKAAFYVRQITAALSPTNFVVTNPVLFKETVAQNGANLVEGMKKLAEDIKSGQGDLRIRQTDMTKFKVGENMAVTPGKVVAENDLCQIIQYEAATDEVLKRPLLICPPWINKFYVLDLNPQKSFIKWCVDQGHTVFVISWVNPDERHAGKDWSDYARDGIDFALDSITKATGEKEVNAIGYCVGGTLLAATLALHAERGDKRIKTATLFTTQVDFTHAGDLKVFVDEPQILTLEKSMAADGYLEGSKMALAFNMLRASELIWPYFVNNYLKGQEPMAFDLLFWNADSTRMAAANHSFYLRNCYLDNTLAQGKMVLDDKTLNLAKVKIPIYNLAAREDHIAPAKSVFTGSKLFGGEVKLVVSGSGHIAGVVNHPEKNKYQYWTNGEVAGDYEDWIASAEETAGSWWPNWHEWIIAHNDKKAKPRRPGGDQLNPIEEAPGSYVRVRV